MQPKSPATLRNEKFFLSPIRSYFADKIASGITLHDCDKYRDWRFSGGYVSHYRVRGGNPRTIKTKGGNRSVDLELQILSNAFHLAVRQDRLKSNPFDKRGRYSVASKVRHCREVAPTPDGAVGGVTSAVAIDAVLLGPDRFPAPSIARTVYAYEVADVMVVSA